MMMIIIIIIIIMLIIYCISSKLKGKGDFISQFMRPLQSTGSYHLLSRLRTFLTLIGGLLAPLLTVQGPSRAHNQTLPRVAAVRGRVVCARCHDENDDTFYFCQWCAPSSSVSQDKSEAGTLNVNMDAVRTRFTQFTTAANSSASAARRDATALLFEQFLLSRASGGSQRVQTAQPSDIVEFLCWLDACGPRRRTPVHAVPPCIESPNTYYPTNVQPIADNISTTSALKRSPRFTGLGMFSSH